jgi:hypothetical protein
LPEPPGLIVTEDGLAASVNSPLFPVLVAQFKVTFTGAEISLVILGFPTACT